MKNIDVIQIDLYTLLTVNYRYGMELTKQWKNTEIKSSGLLNSKTLIDIK